ncbi:hypothetical protein FDC35_06860 [Clostridium botulinum]|nr:hypothetical protein [Clostridium botulinum]NFP00620.1 hypothetical protein [Clostridium botulinum]
MINGMITSFAECWINREKEQEKENIILINREIERQLKVESFNNILSFADSVFMKSEKLN